MKKLFLLLGVMLLFAFVQAQPSNPCKGCFPSQTGHTGQFLQTNGSAMSWQSAGGTVTGTPKEIPYFNALGFITSDARFTRSLTTGTNIESSFSLGDSMLFRETVNLLNQGIHAIQVTHLTRDGYNGLISFDGSGGGDGRNASYFGFINPFTGKVAAIETGYDSAANIGQVNLQAKVGSVHHELVVRTDNGIKMSGNTGFISYSLTFPQSNGTNGYFLKTDGAGALSWASAGGGGYSIQDSAWSLLGNSGTIPTKHFLGTKAGVDSLLLRVGGKNSGQIEGISYNTAIGLYCLDSNKTGYGNSAFGARALSVHKSNNYNTACGYATLMRDTTGTSNTAIGYGAGANITSGSYNIFIGTSADAIGSVDHALVFGNIVGASDKISFSNDYTSLKIRLNTIVGTGWVLTNSNGDGEALWAPPVRQVAAKTPGQIFWSGTDSLPTADTGLTYNNAGGTCSLNVGNDNRRGVVRIFNDSGKIIEIGYQSGSANSVLNFPTNTSNLGTAGMFLKNTNGDGNVLWADAPSKTVASADLTAQTTSVATVCATTPASNGTYRIGGYVNITAVTAGVVTLKVTYTDENSQSVTQILPLTIAATGVVGTTATVLNSNNSATDIQIRAKSGGTITVLTTLTVGTATYDVGGTIELLR